MQGTILSRLTGISLLGTGMERVWEDLRQCHRLRNEMAHLINSWQAYIMFEVVEAAWTAFMERLKTTQDLDGLIRKPVIRSSATSTATVSLSKRLDVPIKSFAVHICHVLKYVDGLKAFLLDPS